MHITFRADTTISACIYINIKIDKVWTSITTLTLVVETWVLFATHHTSMVISYMKEKLQSFHAYWSFRVDTTTTFYFYNIKNSKVWTHTVTLTLVVETRVLFVTHHTSMVISYVKEKLKSFHAYWSFRADTTTTVYMYKAGQTDEQTDWQTVWF
jgi:hypothetical protein